MKKNHKKWIAVVLVAVLAFIWQVYGIKYVTALMSFENILQDVTYCNPVGSTQNIKIIGIDEETLKEYGKFEEWSREKTADLIKLLNSNPDSRPAVVGLDILLMGESSADGTDNYLTEACEEAGNVVVVSKLVYRTLIEQDKDTYFYDEWNVDMIEKPYEELAAVTRQGFANAMIDKDGYIRRAKLAAECRGEKEKSFACEIAEEFLEKPLIEEDTIVRFLFSGEPGEYEKVSFCDVLEGRVDIRAFEDSIVLVGAYAPGMQDAYNVAVERGAQMYGVEVHANIIEALLTDKIVSDIPVYISTALIVIVLAAYILLGHRQKLLHAILEGAAIMVAWLLAGILLKNIGFLLPLSVVEAGTGILMIYFVITKYILEKLGKKRMLKAFERYVAPQVVKELSRQEDFEVKLGGERRDIAVLFVDIRGFTTMSEKLLPEQVVEILNEYLDLTSRAIFKNEGTLDKFIGDATMAVFNAPVDLEDYVYKAVCAAADMVKEARELEKKLEERFGSSVQFGIGINCGPAIVGNIGSERRMDYTAIGDTVNTAARLESTAGRGEILISQAVYEVVKDRIEAEPVGELSLKGKLQKIQTYRLNRIK